MAEIVKFRFSKEVMQDLELISKYKHIHKKLWLVHALAGLITREKADIIRKLEDEWAMNQISDVEFKRLIGKMPSDIAYMKRERYKISAQKGLLGNMPPISTGFFEDVFTWLDSKDVETLERLHDLLSKELKARKVKMPKKYPKKRKYA